MGNTESAKRDKGFDWYSTASQVAEKYNEISLEGKNVIVTGANSGIGKETSRVLASKGARVIMGCRNAQRGNEAVNDLLKENANYKVSFMQLDLGSMQAIRTFAQEFNQLDIPLHVLICNAGIMAPATYQETTDGLEVQFGTNHIGHFLLTKLLLPRLKQGAPSRVVVVASAAHRTGQVNLQDHNGKDTWYLALAGKWKAYGASKSANILFVKELARRMKEEGVAVNAYALHPGAISTGLQNDLTFVEKTFLDVSSIVFKTIPQGAATSVYVAISPDLNNQSGGYYSDSSEATPAPHASDPAIAAALWELSERLTQHILPI